MQLRLRRHLLRSASIAPGKLQPVSHRALATGETKHNPLQIAIRNGSTKQANILRAAALFAAILHCASLAQTERVL
jgi:hypothetical protein